MFINAQIALAILTFTSALAAPTTIHAGKGDIEIPAGAKNVRVHQSYNTHHHHSDPSDPYDEKVHYRLPDRRSKHENSEDISAPGKKGKGEMLAASSSDDDGKHVPGHHHRDDRHHGRHRGKHGKHGKRRHNAEVVYSHGRHGTTIITDGHHRNTIITNGRHGHDNTIITNGRHGHDNVIVTDRALKARHDRTVIIEDGHGHHHGYDHDHDHDHGHYHGHNHRRSPSPSPHSETVIYEDEGHGHHHGHGHNHHHHRRDMEEDAPAEETSVDDPEDADEASTSSEDPISNPDADSSLAARDSYYYNDEWRHGRHHHHHKGWYWKGTARHIWVEDVSKRGEPERVVGVEVLKEKKGGKESAPAPEPAAEPESNPEMEEMEEGEEAVEKRRYSSHRHSHHHHHHHKKSTVKSRHSGETIVVHEGHGYDGHGHGHRHGHGHSHSHSHDHRAISKKDTVIVEDGHGHRHGHGHGHDHSHSHGHGHHHKRSALNSNEKRDWTSEGTAGYIDVTSPLFGSDLGQRIASLVLSAGNSSLANSSFVLNASNGTRTQIYLVPTNSSNFSAEEEGDASLIEVSLKIPVFSPLLAAMVPYCATFDPNPPAPCPLSVQACDGPASDHSSQRFVYAPATGVFRPLWSSNTEVDSNGTTSTDTQSKRDYVVQAAQVFQATVNETVSMPSPSAVASSVVSSLPTPAIKAVDAPTTTSSGSSSPSPSSTGSAQSVSLVFTPVNAAAVLAVDDMSKETFPQHVRPSRSASASSMAPTPTPTSSESSPASSVPSSTFLDVPAPPAEPTTAPIAAAASEPDVTYTAASDDSDSEDPMAAEDVDDFESPDSTSSMGGSDAASAEDADNMDDGSAQAEYLQPQEEDQPAAASPSTTSSSVGASSAAPTPTNAADPYR